MGRVDGKVALITGAGRGQGRAHAVRLAQEGADIIAIDSCVDNRTAPYPMATEADLAETERLVEAVDRRVIAAKVDVRDYDGLADVVDRGLSQFGHIDIVAANAGILKLRKAWEFSQQEWQDILDVNLTGIWNTTKAVIPAMIEADRGGSIVLTSSLAGTKGFLNNAAYVAAKHGVTGLMRTLANELGPHFIRVNSLHPTNVSTAMVHNDETAAAYCPDVDPSEITEELFAERAAAINAIPVPWIDPSEISNAVLWLASDESRYVTGLAMAIDAGAAIK